jgi:hypothetical protein
VRCTHIATLVEFDAEESIPFIKPRPLVARTCRVMIHFETDRTTGATGWLVLGKPGCGTRQKSHDFCYGFGGHPMRAPFDSCRKMREFAHI